MKLVRRSPHQAVLTSTTRRGGGGGAATTTTIAAANNNPLREIQNNHKHTKVTIPVPVGGKRRLPFAPESLIRARGVVLPRGGGGGGQRKRKVRFNMSDNQTYENHRRLSTDDCRGLWYSSHEIRVFQKDTREQDLRTSHPSYNAWATTLHRVYHAFCTYNNAQEILNLLDQAPPVFDAAGLGMERRAVSVVAEDAASRRRQIYAHVQKCQAAPISDPSLRAQMIREMCRTVSKPSRLYARHIAHMTAMGECR